MTAVLRLISKLSYSSGLADLIGRGCALGAVREMRNRTRCAELSARPAKREGLANPLGCHEGEEVVARTAI